MGDARLVPAAARNAARVQLDDEDLVAVLETRTEHRDPALWAQVANGLPQGVVPAGVRLIYRRAAGETIIPASDLTEQQVIADVRLARRVLRAKREHLPAAAMAGMALLGSRWLVAPSRKSGHAAAAHPTLAAAAALVVVAAGVIPTQILDTPPPNPPSGRGPAATGPESVVVPVPPPLTPFEPSVPRGPDDIDAPTASEGPQPRRLPAGVESPGGQHGERDGDGEGEGAVGLSIPTSGPSRPGPQTAPPSPATEPNGPDVRIEVGSTGTVEVEVPTVDPELSITVP